MDKSTSFCLWQSDRIMTLLAFFLLVLCFGVPVSASRHGSEEFSEELLLRPLPDGKVMTHFQFTNTVPQTKQYGHHHRLFPKAIYQLVQKFRIQEMEVSFTHGRWNYDRWGGVDPVAGINAKPSGVEMWAVFAVPDEQIDTTWRNLTHALSGLFCASLNFLESSAMIANPVRAFETKQSRLNHGQYTELRHVTYGALPREAVCTENLTPWLKLLPCRDKAGLAMLLDRPIIYRGSYHSLRLYVASDEFESQEAAEVKGTFLQQTLTLVTELSENTLSRIGKPRMQPSWSLSSLFGKAPSSGCPLAKSSTVYLELEGDLLEKLAAFGVARHMHEMSPSCIEDGSPSNIGETQTDLKNRGKNCLVESQKPSGLNVLESLIKNDAYALHGDAGKLFWDLKEDAGNGRLPNALLGFSVPKHVNNHAPLDVGISWKVPLTWMPSRGPYRASRFLVGSGNARGSIAVLLKSNNLQRKGFSDSSELVGQVLQESGVTDIMIFQVVPWYIRLYLHTLQVLVNGQQRPFQEVVKWMQVVPSEDRKSPGIMELELNVPSNASVVALMVDFDKGFLRIDEHPPDANRGFDLPSALITFPDQNCERHYELLISHDEEVQDSQLLRDFQKSRSMQVYTEVLLVPLATPDFSMPYNVITLTCTVLALYFGSLLNILRRRIGEEERLASTKEVSPSGKIEHLLSKLFGRRKEISHFKLSRPFKFIFVAIVAVAANYYFTTK